MRVVVAALVFCAIAGLAEAQTPPPVEAFGRLPAVVDAAISPDGTRVVLARTEGAASYMQVYDVDQRQIIASATVGDESRLRGVGWTDDERASLLISRTFPPGAILPGGVRFRGNPRRIDYYRTGVLNVATRDIRMLTVNEDEPWADQGARLIAPIADDPGYARMIGRSHDIATTFPVVYRVNLGSGAVRRETVRGVTRNTFAYTLDHRGAVVARTDANRETNRWQLWVYDGDTPRLLMEDVSEFGEPISIAGILADGRLAALEQDAAGEFYVLNAIDPQNGAREVLFARPGFEIDSVIRDPWTRQVVGVSWIEDERKQHFFDEGLQRINTALAESFPGGAAVMSSWSQDRRRAVIYGERGLDGGAYYLFDATENRLTRLAQLYPELANAQLGERQSVMYRARDGVRIPGYLTLPSGQDPRNLPLVVLVHGGPASRDTLAFDYQAAFLASRGYAVLQPNFRGSSGYGVTWERAGRRQWGGLMQTDVEDGVGVLVRAGTVDAARVCIVGASYGGYAALAGVTLTPDVYRCAVSIAGVSDLIDLIDREGAETGRDSISSDYWRTSIGDRREDRDAIMNVSPVRLAHRVSAPVLLMHGTDDTVVPIDQSRRMERALRQAGKDVRFVELRGDDHYLSDAETRTTSLRETEAFLAQHLRP